MRTGAWRLTDHDPFLLSARLTGIHLPAAEALRDENDRLVCGVAEEANPPNDLALHGQVVGHGVYVCGCDVCERQEAREVVDILRVGERRRGVEADEDRAAV